MSLSQHPEQTAFPIELLPELIGQEFSLSDQHGAEIAIKLTRVNQQGGELSPTETVSAFFEYPENSIASDQVFTLSHTDIGQHQLLISRKSATECELIISRLMK